MHSADPLLEYRRNRAKAVSLGLGLCAALLFVMIVSLRLGALNISVMEILRTITEKIFRPEASNSSITAGIAAIIWELRLPRILCGALAGAGLAVSGTIFQAILQNPLADPYTLGISTGAAFGAALAIFVNTVIGLALPVSPAALLFASLTLIIVIMISERGGASVSSLIMAGIIAGAVFSAGISFLKMLSGENVAAIVFWLMGSLSARGWRDVILLAAFIPASLVIAGFFSGSLNVLSLGSTSASSLGVNVKRTRLLYLLLGSAISAVCVSVCGVIGFVGLIVPHLLRMSISSDNRLLIPLSAVSGALLLCVADTCVRLIGSGEIPVGVLTTLAGGPFFICLFLRRRGIREL